MKMKTIQVSCAQTRAARVAAVNGGRSAILRPPYAVGSPRNFGFSNSRSHSVCTFCRMFQPYRVLANSLVISAMSNACSTRFRSIHCRAATLFGSRKSCGCGISRTFSTCTSPFTLPTGSLVVRPPSPLVLVAALTPSNVPQLSNEWFSLRRDKLTTSTFSTALGFWKGKRRSELWHEKVFVSETQFPEASKRAMEWGMLKESTAIERYKSLTGREVGSYGFAVHPEEQLNWVGASPDGLLGCVPGGGILEVKCPYNKGKPETGLPWSTMPFYYMPQIQGQMEIMNREWVDLYCWTPNGSTIFRIYRERSYWNLMHGVLREFWWENVIPAREALSLGRKEDANAYEPSSTHKLTGLVIAKSIKLANESKLLCKEIAGHVEYFR